MKEKNLFQKNMGEICPNCFYEDEEMLIGEFNTWEEVKNHPLYDVMEMRVGEELFNRFTKVIKRHEIIIYNKKNNTFTRGCYDVENQNVVGAFSGPNGYVNLTENTKIIKILKEKFSNTKQIDIEKEGYELSSELFSFKDMRRGVIEHGKTCYIEGYKKHADLFSNFLLKNGYFSKEELNKITEEFNEYLQKPYKINREDIEKFLPEITCRFEKENWGLTKAQESIISSYALLTDDYPMLLIKKPRQKGVTSLLKTIAYIEASKNNKKVWYLGYGPCKPLKDCKNITYRQLHIFSEIEPSECCGKRSDLIIVDEMTAFKNPPFTLVNILPCLNKGGKIIVVGTIEDGKDFPLDTQTISRYNENVNKFFDNPGVSIQCIKCIINDND